MNDHEEVGSRDIIVGGIEKLKNEFHDDESHAILQELIDLIVDCYDGPCRGFKE